MDSGVRYISVSTGLVSKGKLCCSRNNICSNMGSSNCGKQQNSMCHAISTNQSIILTYILHNLHSVYLDHSNKMHKITQMTLKRYENYSSQSPKFGKKLS